MPDPQVTHQFLDCGIELVVLPLPERRTVSGEFRFLAGFVHEPVPQLGINHIVEQTITKGTARYDGRALSDAFDAIGARWASYAGRESTGYQFTCLPEFLDQTIDLHAEFLRNPTFPGDSVGVAIDNTLQEITNIEDDPDDLSAMLFNRQVYGPVLGRHVLGETQVLKTLKRDDISRYYEEHYCSGRMQVAIAGPVDGAAIIEQLNVLFGGYGSAEVLGRERVPYTFEARVCHYPRDFEQEHIGICYPGAPLGHDQRYAQQVTMGVLAGGMSGRLFTEVREKQGLVYWVTAWTEHPRGVGIVYIGASTTPQRCDKTYATLLREVNRLQTDVTGEEVERAITGIVAKAETRGDITRARRSEVAEDLFHYGRIIPRKEKLAAIAAVTVDDVRNYLHSFPRDRLSVMTLGPRELTL